MTLQTYRFDLSRAFPELPEKVQTTPTSSDRPAAVLTLVVAYLLSGNRFQGAMEDVTPAEIHAELVQACREYQIHLPWIFDWAESLLIPPETTLDADTLDAVVPSKLEQFDFSLHQYQRRAAGWCAYRRGSVLNFGCGVGKSVTSTAAAIAALRLGKCSGTRCLVVAPLNAIPQWRPYLRELRRYYDDVQIVSVDSLHLMQAISRYDGGALIVDECHKCKTDGRNRTTMAHNIRSRFQWSVCLTGTLFQTGCEGVMSVFDLACPGLSRYIDPYDFGEQFDAVKVVEVPTPRGKQQRRSLTLPAESNHDEFVRFISRAVRSLTLDSPEVKEEVQVPDQFLVLEEEWEAPQWVQDLKAEWKKEAKEGEDCPYLWTPNLGLDDLGGAIAVAMMEENREILLERLRDDYGRHFTPEELPAACQLVQDWLKDDPDNEALKQLVKLSGLPHISSLFWNMRVDGRWDRIIQRVRETVPGTENVHRTTYRWVYAPGTDRTAPAPGPKIRWVENWLQETGDEPLVCGCASVPTLDTLASMFDTNKVSYRIIRGGVDDKDREAFVRDFQDGKFRVMLVQQIAGSESVTLTRANTSFLVDITDSPLAYTQFLARTRRIRQTRECMHHDFVFNIYQRLRVEAIRAGHNFDAEIRTKLESTLREAYNAVFA